MDTSAVRKLLHDLSNALNAAKINAYLLRRMDHGSLDKETMDSLDSSLFEAEGLVADFQRRIYEDIEKEGRVTVPPQ